MNQQSKKKKGTILSGMRPTGPLHLGHLVGALGNWAQLQDEYQCYYMVADYHALMSEYRQPQIISQATREVVLDWLACGLDPQRCAIFRQSDVPAHAELHLILSCIVPIGWLERVPTYKEQLHQLKHKEINTYAFLGYPCLQAADILIYKANTVPVGEDQASHLELTREVARRFNSLLGEVFPEPAALILKEQEGGRLLGLDRRKMSKSYENAINLKEEPESMRKKVSSMITDPQRRTKKDPGRPDFCNVATFYRLFAPDLYQQLQVADKCSRALWGCVECKSNMYEGLAEYLKPIQEKRRDLAESPETVEEILQTGAAQAAKTTSETLEEVRQKCNFKGKRSL